MAERNGSAACLARASMARRWQMEWSRWKDRPFSIIGKLGPVGGGVNSWVIIRWRATSRSVVQQRSTETVKTCLNGDAEGTMESSDSIQPGLDGWMVG